MKKKNNKLVPQEPKDTGHEWDGIREYDNPDVLWLRYTFYITVFFALGYWLLYPAWPTPHSPGILNWSSEKEVKEQLQALEKVRKQYQDEFDKASFEEILKNPKLLKFGLAGGQSVFQNNCAMCHGAGGGGNIGYPNLTAGAWLWGGKLEDIYTTLKYGIRSDHPEARQSAMAAFGKDGVLTSAQIYLVTDYVLSLSTKNVMPTDSAGGKIFAEQCASCHGDKGQGGRDFGAPALNDAIWLYGSDKEQIFDIIYHGRAGLMPYWEGKLSDSSIKQAVIYVHQLGGGE